MIGYIYMTTCKINGKRYIGRKTSQVFLGEQYLGSGKHLKNAVQKYGSENFTVTLIEWCETPEDLINREAYWIAYYRAVESDDFYNHSAGGWKEGFIPGEANIAKTERSRKINSQKHKGKKMGAEFSRKQSEIHLGKPSGMKGKHHSENTKEILSIKTSQRNKKYSNDFYQKVGESKKGNKMMNKDGICVRVHPQDFDSYLADGWIFGGLPRKGSDRSSQWSACYSAGNGKIWVHRDKENKLINPDELLDYLREGWRKGRTR